MTLPQSRLARLQQGITWTLLAAAAVWLWCVLPRAPWLAVVGLLVICCGHAVVLGLEFLVLRQVSRGDPAPRPTAAELVTAWWAEVRTAPLVFCWRQPFRWRAEPDNLGADVAGRRGVVLVHGFVCNRGFWNPWLRRLRGLRHGFVAVNLEPVFGSIDTYADIVDAAVRRVHAATGHHPVVVCHSMGGLAARAWLRAHPDAAARVHCVITIGSPHHGTWLARFSRLTNGRQMRIAGDWLVSLEASERGRQLPPFTCWYSNCDNIVFPPSTAALAGADNRLLRGVAHVDLAYHPEVVEGSLRLLREG